MIGGIWCHLDGCSGSRDGNLVALRAAGAPSTRENSRAARTMTPVLQDKRLHSTVLAARIPAIYFALYWPIVALFTRMRNIFCHLIVAAAKRPLNLSQRHSREILRPALRVRVLQVAWAVVV